MINDELRTSISILVDKYGIEEVRKVTLDYLREHIRREALISAARRVGVTVLHYNPDLEAEIRIRGGNT